MPRLEEAGVLRLEALFWDEYTCFLFMLFRAFLIRVRLFYNISFYLGLLSTLRDYTLFLILTRSIFLAIFFFNYIWKVNAVHLSLCLYASFLKAAACISRCFKADNRVAIYIDEAVSMNNALSNAL